MEDQELQQLILDAKEFVANNPDREHFAFHVFTDRTDVYYDFTYVPVEEAASLALGLARKWEREKGCARVFVTSSEDDEINEVEDCLVSYGAYPI